MTSVLARLTPKTEELRGAILKNLLSGASIAEKDEPNTVKYLIAIPQDSDAADPGSIYVIEEYLDKAGFELHCQQQAVQNVIRMIGDGALVGNSMSLILGLDHDISFIRPEVAQAPDAFVVLVQIFCKPEAGAEVLHALKIVADASAEESGTLGLVVYPDPKNLDVIRFMGVYKSRDYYEKVHVKSKEVQEFQIATKDISVEHQARFLKPIGGFLYKRKG